MGGHSCKISNMRPHGTLEYQNPQFEKIFKFGLLFCDHIISNEEKMVGHLV